MTNQNQKNPDAQITSILEEAKQGGVLSEKRMDALMSAFLLKEARLAEKEAALEVALQARDANRRRESENFTIEKIETQKNCKHLKGGKGRTRGQQRDPAVYLHTFTDGKPQIKCTLCGAKWFPGDTDEYLTRSGSKIPNWTGIGWRRASEMCEDSSNKASSSERFTGQHISSTATEAGKALANTKNLQL